MGKLNLSSETDPASRTAIIIITGDLDAETVPALMKAFKEIFEKKFYKIIVAMENLNYIASVGVSAFLSNIQEAREKGGDIILLNPAPRVNKVFTLLGLQKIMKIVPDKKTAQEELEK